MAIQHRIKSTQSTLTTFCGRTAIVRRAAFRVNKLDWPFRRGEAPVVQEHEVLSLALDDKLVRRMILAARRDAELPAGQRRLHLYDTLYLALGATYAARCARTRQSHVGATAWLCVMDLS